MRAVPSQLPVPAICLRLVAMLLVLCVGASAQQAMGTVATHDALVTGGLEVRGERATLLTNASITAYDRTAPITLARGGEVLVCATSQFHLLRSGAAGSLLFGLDRGAIEIRSNAATQDIILTPDLRFTLVTPGPLDLRLRVTTEGDTCVENAGAKAPVLGVVEAFSAAAYRVLPGQHVLFEHGSLRQVVDRERSSCGCPPPAQVVVAKSKPGEPATSTQAAAEHPFPVAVSQGLAPETKPVRAAGAPPSSEASLTFSADEAAKVADDTAASPAPAAPVKAAAAPATVSGAPPPTPPGAHDVFHAIRHFFGRVFHRKPVS